MEEFLNTMKENGITKISAISLLYERIDRRLKVLEDFQSVSKKRLDSISKKLARPPEVSIIDLPPMEVLSFILKKDRETTDTDGFIRRIQQNAMAAVNHGHFEFQSA